MMEWQDYYRKMHPYYSERDKRNGLKDWTDRISTIVNWLNQENFDNNCRMLDCGCGIGISGRLMKNNGFSNIIGIDTDKKCLKLAGQFYKTEFGDCENIKLPKKSFDVILGLNIIEHLEHPEKFLSGVKKTLKPSGILILSLPNSNLFRKFVGKTIDIEEHINQWGPKSFKEFLENRGFKILDIRPVGRFPFLFMCNTFMVLARVK